MSLLYVCVTTGILVLIRIYKKTDLREARVKAMKERMLQVDGNNL